MKRTLSRLAAMLCALILCVSCACAEMQEYEVTFFNVFDTFSRIAVYAPSQAQAQTWCQTAYTVLLECHRLYDIYNDYEGVTNLKTLNDTAAQGPVAVDGRIMDLLAYARDMYDLTGGRTNVAMGAVLRLWHDARDTGVLPDAQALQAAAKHTDISDLVLDQQAGTVFFADPELKLDVGAIAKGYATELAALALEEAGVTSGLLSIGGNVRIIGVKPDGSPYRAGIQDPNVPDGSTTIAVVELNDQSLVTSGDYQRYIEVDGVRYHHIIDPDTLMPAAHMRSVSVRTHHSGLADALSTALFTLPLEDGLALVESLEDVEAVWITAEETMVCSSGIAPVE